jgi:hypothetical protein
MHMSRRPILTLLSQSVMFELLSLLRNSEVSSSILDSEVEYPAAIRGVHPLPKILSSIL